MDVFGWEKPVVGLLVTVFQIAFRCVSVRFWLCYSKVAGGVETGLSVCVHAVAILPIRCGVR